VCHLNTCPVGVATQDPELRKKFSGQPEHVINFFHFIAEELREIMASLGFRTVDEMVGKVEKLDVRDAVEQWKARGLDFSKVLYKPEVGDDVGIYHTEAQDHGLDGCLDLDVLLDLAAPALENGTKVEHDIAIRNINRTAGTILSSEVSKRYGDTGLPDDTITFNCKGSAGQSFCCFGARGITMRVEGDANDYFCKGLSGARVMIYPPAVSTFVAEENILVGNVALYGATSGELYARGIAGERFCVRNSGARAVVEGVGDHCCEYMTGGCTVVLGATGRNFAAGMSGGVAYVLDEAGDFEKYRCNLEMVGLEDVVEVADIDELREMIENHLRYTDSAVAKRVLDNWDESLNKFIKVMPTDYKRALQRIAAEQAEAAEVSV
jgi:glutamate synthase domain-containing protein 3